MISLQSTSKLPTIFGDFTISTFSEVFDDPTPIIVLSNMDQSTISQIPVVRLHSECLTGEVFGSLKCDCGQQLAEGLRMIQAFGGYLIYLRQEGRGIGITNKIRAYHLQDQGLNTLEANLHLGFKGDEREYSSAIEILKLLGVSDLKLITNNPDKISYVQNAGFNVLERIPLIINPNDVNRDYLNVKRDLMGHLL